MEHDKWPDCARKLSTIWERRVSLTSQPLLFLLSFGQKKIQFGNIANN